MSKSEGNVIDGVGFTRVEALQALAQNVACSLGAALQQEEGTGRLFVRTVHSVRYVEFCTVGKLQARIWRALISIGGEGLKQCKSKEQ